MSTNDAATVADLMKLFHQYEPLSNLNEAGLLQLAKGASRFDMNKRRHLLAADEHRWLIYLVSGSLQGKGAQGETFSIRTSRHGQMALFDAQPRPIEVTVEEDSQFLRVDRKQFSVLMNEQISRSTLVEEIDSEDEELFKRLIESGAAKLPLRDSVVNTAVSVLEGGNAGVDLVLLDLMRSEPSLALVVASITGDGRQHEYGALTGLKQLLDGVDHAQLAVELRKWGEEQPFPEVGTPLYKSIVTAYDYLRRVAKFSAAIAQELGQGNSDLVEYVGMCSKVGVVSSWLVSPQEHRVEGQDKAKLSQLVPLVTEMLLAQMHVDSEVMESVEAIGIGDMQGSEISASDIVRMAMTYLPIDILGAPVGLVEDEALTGMFSLHGVGLRELDIIMEKCNLDANSGLSMAG